MNHFRQKIRVCFLFSSSGIGGAERSMLRFMEFTQSKTTNCEVILGDSRNTRLAHELHTLKLPLRFIAPFSIRKLVSAIRSIDPHIVYLFGPTRTVPWAVAAKIAGVPVIISAERSSMSRVIDRSIRKIDRHLVDAYICNSKAAQTVLHNKLHIPNDRIYVVYNGIEVHNRRFMHPEQRLSHEPSIICIANIRRLKGQIVLLRAIKHLQSKYPKLKALLVGGDTTDGRFFQMVKEEGLNSTYIWTGYVSNVIPYLLKAEIFVLPSLSREGTPTSILEAMLAGVPVIASDIGGVSELIQDGATGFLVPPGDPIALAERIERLLESESLRKEIVSNAFRFINDKHSIDSMVNGHIEVFTQLLASKGI